MNIFYLDVDPVKAAQSHHNNHCGKMIMESAQMLSTAIWELDPDYAKANRFPDGSGVCRAAYVNHPCTKWTRQSSGNFIWLLMLFRALAREYKHRYGTNHGCWVKRGGVIDCWDYHDKFVESDFTSPPLCMPVPYKVYATPVECYRAYYVGEKMFNKNGRRMAFWKRRSMPEWVPLGRLLGM